ncbi:bifunctional serine/threonine-protein kinase/formylglycine-generating enzyme family protein [Merismopedia glauca]|uniref:Protein kinase domain-containing protein n=1 Tax=Merismopedia glauca CCAP 1448/3 TaxID=1296344 RepID=A0A2T1C2W5_9CYAN|nr:bifunctional serine/threonine-protein kinase/formylglycine-generating enzyme family protein [Merismopedia glauca]PSB02610.1 hypothetical protein C7B64_12235 [Merismopedia glauca CCAP 1448/3]
MQFWKPNQPIQNGKYIIEKHIASGGFGITYKARDTYLDRLVAIKTLNPQRELEATFATEHQKFVTEAQRLARCPHRHIVPIYDLIQEEGMWGMVMEYVAGEDLASYIADRGVFSEAEAISIIEKVGDALQFIHNIGLLHRDIKPNNIILRQDTKLPVLIDFGLAREFNLGQSLSLTNYKTHGYAPPEQYEKHGKFGAYTDVYALAATLYVLLTQERLLASIYRHEESLKDPKQHNPKISDRVNQAIMKGMELLPQNRPQSVKEWLDLLGKPSVKLPVLKTFKFEVVTLKSEERGLFSKKTVLVESKTTKQAEYLTEDLGGGVTLDIVSIPGGTFMMGSPIGERSDRDKTRDKVYDREKPQHLIAVSPFFIGKFVVTQAQWSLVAKFPKINCDLKLEPSHFKGANRPVERVNWYHAIEFCARLSHHTGRIYRLPTEAEWEYACRAGTTTPFHFGETITTDLANYNGTYTYGSTPKGIYREQTTDVGSFPANAFGLYDLHGNVFEWCADPWHENYEGAPSSSRVWDVGGDKENYCLRGGSWLWGPYPCRSACRDFLTRAGVNHICGFRVACFSNRTV